MDSVDLNDAIGCGIPGGSVLVVLDQDRAYYSRCEPELLETKNIDRTWRKV